MYYNALLFLIFFEKYLVNSQNFHISKSEYYNEFEVPLNVTGGPLYMGCDFKSIAVIEVDTKIHSIKLSMEFKLNWVDDRLNITVKGQHSKVQITIKKLNF